MRNSRQAAFTLVELIVVLGIIIMLAGLLFPLIGRAREAGKRAQCLGNLRSLTQAWLAYASENNGRFCSGFPNTGDNPGGITPGFYWGWVNTTPPNPLDIVRRGNLWHYLNDTAVYRCPDDTTDTTINPFSYAINGYLAGPVGNPFPLKKLDDIPAAAKTFVFIEQSAPLVTKGNASGKISGDFSTPLYPNPPVINGNAWPGQNHKGSKAYVDGTSISFADGHAIFWTYSDTRTGNLQEASAARLGTLLTNSPDVFQLMSWSGGPMPPDPPKLYDPTQPWP
jgi:type II secretory pathway pseudopilin PulG